MKNLTLSELREMESNLIKIKATECNKNILGVRLDLAYYIRLKRLERPVLG